MEDNKTNTHTYENHIVKVVEVKKPHLIVKVLEKLGKWFASIRIVIEKAKKYDQIETIFASNLTSKFTTYKIDGDRVILRELMTLVVIANQIGLNGSTSQLRDEIIEEHVRQLEITNQQTTKKNKK